MIRIEKGNEIWDALENMEAKILFKVYLFNITNPDEVYNGGTPNLEQVGPYVYE